MVKIRSIVMVDGVNMGVNARIMCLFPGVLLSYGSFADGDVGVVVGLGEVDARVP